MGSDRVHRPAACPGCSSSDGALIDCGYIGVEVLRKLSAPKISSTKVWVDRGAAVVLVSRIRQALCAKPMGLAALAGISDRTSGPVRAFQSYEVMRIYTPRGSVVSRPVSRALL